MQHLHVILKVALQKMCCSSFVTLTQSFCVCFVSSALLLLYDITSKSSFDNIRVSLGLVPGLGNNRVRQDGWENDWTNKIFGVTSNIITLPSCEVGRTVNLFEWLLLLFQAWLTEIHEYAQSDVVIMLLGNKVRGTCLCVCVRKREGEGKNQRTNNRYIPFVFSLFKIPSLSMTTFNLTFHLFWLKSHTITLTNKSKIQSLYIVYSVGITRRPTSLHGFARVCTGSTGSVAKNPPSCPTSAIAKAQSKRGSSGCARQQRE